MGLPRAGPMPGCRLGVGPAPGRVPLGVAGGVAQLLARPGHLELGLRLLLLEELLDRVRHLACCQLTVPLRITSVTQQPLKSLCKQHSLLVLEVVLLGQLKLGHAVEHMNIRGED